MAQQVSSQDGTQPGLVGPVPYNPPSLFRRARYLSALLGLCISSDVLLYVVRNGGWRGITEGELGAVRPRSLAAHVGVELPVLATWLASALSDGYVLRVTDPIVYLAAGNSSQLVVVRASCLAVAWLGSWRRGEAL